MQNIELIATTTFGLEAVVKREIQNLGYSDLNVSDGKVTFVADEKAIPKANLWLRSADRLLLKIGEFTALSFDELFEKTKALPWGDWITRNAKFTVNGKSVKSKLFSISDCQAIVKKAVVEKLKTKYAIDWFEETGPSFTIQVALLNDVATLTIDTSGVGLHKRGYRQLAGEAPLKETMAAALIQLSYWRKNRVLLDPFCGSGTIPIEAALIGKNIAPGLSRTFASEEWPRIDQKIWKEIREEASDVIDKDNSIEILASDINDKTIKIAIENASKARVENCIRFETMPISQVQLKNKYGVVITNPPYSERIGTEREVNDMYKTMGKIFRPDPTWSVYVLTASESFEKLYGARADRKRKLYNGNIKVDFYQYYGERPPKQE